MQSTVSCDHVFDVLTRQPFPSGNDDDGIVEEHIRACHECRRLAEALRPAVGLIHESIHHANRIDGLNGSPLSELPRYSGLVDQAEETNIERVMEQVYLAGEATAEVQSRGWRPGSFIGIACLAAAILFIFLATQPDAKGSEDLTSDAERFAYLQAAGVPVGCLANVGWHCAEGLEPSKDSKPLEQPAADACCTDCHTAAKGFEKPVDNLKPLAQSCLACHSS